MADMITANFMTALQVGGIGMAGIFIAIAAIYLAIRGLGWMDQKDQM